MKRGIFLQKNVVRLLNKTVKKNENQGFRENKLISKINYKYLNKCP